MSRITQLPTLAPAGDEIVVMVKGGVTAGARFIDLAAPSLNKAALAAEAASVFVRGVMFASTAAGIAGTASGSYFVVAGAADAFAILYRNLSGTAVEQARYTSRAGFAAAGGAALVGYGLLPVDQSMVRTLAQLAGVDQFTTVSQQGKLERAFDIATNDPAIAVLHGHPDANYRHDGPLNLNKGTSFDGQGCTFTALSNDKQAIVVGLTGTSSGFRLANFTTLGASLLRGDALPQGLDIQQGGVVVGDQYAATLYDFSIDNVVVGSVDGVGGEANRGFAGTGIWIANARRGRVNNVSVYHSKADGVTVLHGAEDVTINNPFAYQTGDDAFSTLGYITSGQLTQRITWNSPVSLFSQARVCAVAGGKDVTYNSPRGLNSAASAVVFYSDQAFGTYGNISCHVRDGIFLGPCQGAAKYGANFRNPGIEISGRDGSDTLTDKRVVSRSSIDCTVQATIEGGGAAFTFAFSCQNAYNVNTRADLKVKNLDTGSGVAIGGYDTEVTLHANNIGGLLYFQGSGATGYQKHDIHCDGSRVAQAHPVNASFYFEGNNVDQVDLTYKVRNGPAAAAVNAGLDGTKLRQVNSWLNGVEQVGRDYTTGAITYANAWVASATEGFVVNRFRDGRLLLNGRLKDGAIAAGTLLCTTPTGFRPDKLQVMLAMTDGAKPIEVNWAPDGTVTLGLAPAVTVVRISHICMGA